jgi:hypothetical protein
LDKKAILFKTKPQARYVIIALRRLRQEDQKFKTSLNCILGLRPAWTIQRYFV